MSAAGGTKAIIAALAANLGIAATKFLAFALTDFAAVYLALASGIDPLTSPHVADLRDRTH